MPAISSKTRTTILRIIALVAVVAISVYIFSIRDRAEELAVYGYPGIFLLAFLSYATVFLPAPGVAVIFTMGAVFNPLAVALVAGAGAALGEVVGYMAGFSTQVVTERTAIYQRLVEWMKRNGPVTIFLLSAIPNPFFDLAGVAAGALRTPVPHFLFWCWLGETVKMIFFAYGGAVLLK
ncbi:MAG TPA: VTT domain-containing protein [Anaerolineales bacterium]|nr:VTT domain-containing protein [Anaerolineales bacterium]